MNKGKTAGGVGLALMVAGLVTWVWPYGEMQPGDTQNAPEVVVLLPDGGLAYIAPVTTADGGSTWRFSPPNCVRKLPDAGAEDCKRSFIGLNGPMTMDPGPWTRFPAVQQEGPHCQPVACSVTAGDNPDQEEIDIAQNHPLEPPPEE